MAKPKDTKSNKKSSSTQPTIYVCPQTNQNVYIGKATLKDLKDKSTYTNTTKRLWTLPSPQTRNELYVEAAKALAMREQALLPSFGGRSWEVTCKLTEPSHGGQVLFRAWKGKMELAVLPHLLEKIPTPPTWPGKKTQPDEYEIHEDEEDFTKLQQREVSSLSSLAWELKNLYPVPNVTLKWQSPERKLFYSRKTAWEHATTIAAMEVEINKCILGIGASGKLLQPFLPSVATTLKVGKLRFERDGLWVIGQELAWQEGRPQQLLEEELEQAEKGCKRVPKSGLDLFVMTKRNEYRDAHSDCKTLKQAEIELRKLWKTLSKAEQNEWNKQVRGEDHVNKDEMEEGDEAIAEASKECKSDPPEPEPLKLSMTPQAFYVKSRRYEYREERRAQKRSLSLVECDIWLRQEWKTLDPRVKAEWEQKLIDLETKKAEEAAEVKRQEYEVQQAAAAAAAMAAKAKGTEEIEQEITSPAQEATATEPAPLNPTTKIPVETPRTSLVFDVVEIPLNPDRRSVGIERYVKSPNKGELKASEPPVTDTVSCKESKIETEGSSGSTILHESRQYGEEKKDDDGTRESSLPPIMSDATTSVVTTSTDPSAGTTDDPISDVDSNRSSPAPVFSTVPVVSMPSAAKITAPKPSSRKQQVPTKQATQRWCLNQGQIDLCYAACMDHYETVMRTVKTRDLHRELQDGFDVLRERGYGRYDMELPAFDDPSTFGFLTDMTKAPWMPVVKAILGDDATLIHKGCFLSMPGSAHQEYHQDGVHLTTQTQRACHAINVFVPLVDLTNRNGPTEFCLGSHILGLEGYDRDFVEIPKPKAGTPVIFDYRLGHRGLGNNTSRSCRPIVYCTYARAAQGKEFRDSVNFSRKRYHKIGELSSKPLSREERQNKRKRNVHLKEQDDLQHALEESLKGASHTNTDLTVKDDNGPRSLDEEDDKAPAPQEEINMTAQQDKDLVGEPNDAKLDEEPLTNNDNDDGGGVDQSDPKRIKVYEEAISMVIDTSMNVQ